MYLKNIKLENFRSFDKAEIELQRDLTVFVGENNGGKSNAVDAIRLLTSPLGGRREIYCEQTDVRFQSAATHFDLEASFTELTTGQQGRFLSAVSDTSLTQASFGMRFDSAQPGFKPTLWAGKEGNSHEPGCYEMVRHVYLPPLRDAKRSLASGNPTRIMALLNHFLDGTSPAQLAQELARVNSHNVLTKVNGAVEKNLAALTSGVRRQNASVGFATDESLIDIARDLRFKLADHGVNPEDLRYSGHGYANLLFMATIAVELDKVRNADLTLFLVEEPEAHLHPQLQAAVLAFLQDQAELSRKQTPSNYGPAGELQIIVATHSPNLSASVSSDKLVIFKSIVAPSQQELGTRSIEPTETNVFVIESGLAGNDAISGGADTEPLAVAITASALRRSTHCIPLSKLPLDPIERRKVDRYLDVTKAALLFGGRVLLVEGIAEALLLPAIATHHTLKNHSEKLRLFKSTVFVPIDGVDFTPYATLLMTPIDGARIADRLVIITDGDKGGASDEEGDEESQELGAGVATGGKESISPGQRRKAKLEKCATTWGAAAHLTVITNTYSLEAELLEAGNNSIMRKAYLTLHPRSHTTWDNAVALSSDERAKRIHEIFKDTRKGDFAQILARLIEAGDEFKPPGYITQAIEAVVAT